jgi:hypothetical protein
MPHSTGRANPPMLCRTGHWLRLWPILIAPIERLLHPLALLLTDLVSAMAGPEIRIRKKVKCRVNAFGNDDLKSNISSFVKTPR